MKFSVTIISVFASVALAGPIGPRDSPEVLDTSLLTTAGNMINKCANKCLTNGAFGLGTALCTIQCVVKENTDVKPPATTDVKPAGATDVKPTGSTDALPTGAFSGPRKNSDSEDVDDE